MRTPSDGVRGAPVPIGGFLRCPGEMEQVLMVRGQAQVVVWGVGQGQGEAGWVETALGQVPAGTAFAPVVAPRFPTG